MEVVACATAERGDLFLSEADARPLLRDDILGLEYGEVGEVALVAAGVPTQAEEVVVVATVALGGAIAHASTTASTPKRPLEVVLVPPRSVARDASTGKEVLDSLPQDVVDQRPLVDLFRRAEDSTGLGLRWAVGNALDVTWDDARFDDLVELARDRSYGRAREMVVLGLARSKRPEAGGVLIELLGDTDVNGHAVKALRKLKVLSARAGLERMLDDDRAWVRKETQRALAALA